MNHSTFKLTSNHILTNSSDQSNSKTLTIINGKISKITSGSDSDALNFGDSYIIPGIVDTHAHINEPGRTDWEGFRTATRAAAAGGITTVIDMPLNSIPPTTTLENLKIKQEAARGQCSIDYGFWGGVIPGNSNELSKMVNAGIFGFKCFTIESGVSEFPMATRSDLEIAMPILAKHKIPLLVHAELENTDEKTKHFDSKYIDYLNSRPQSWELNAIQMIIELIKKTNCSAHIVHLSAGSALDLIRDSKKLGLSITVETCPHYLHFESEKIANGATHFKCAPPIREKKNKELLWAGIKDGTIDMIVSDHSPCTPNLKCLDTGNFENAWGGISGLQYSFPIIWTEMKRRGFKLHDAIRLMSENTAKRAGIFPKKGTLQVGSDADFIVFKPETSFQVSPEKIEHKNKLTPYENETLYGKITHTFVRGNEVFNNGKFLQQTIGEPVK